ncbi:hypothetical protein N2W54_006548 [Lotmaria passim]
MSFSVHARAFVPSSSKVLSPLHLCESAATTAPANAASKECVCVAFYENGRCPYGNHCEHAHRFSELTQSTQAKLLGSVPVESIPAHFFGATQPRADLQATNAAVVATAAPDAAVSTSLTAYGHYSPTKNTEAERTVSTRRRPLGKDRHLVVSHIGPRTPTLELASPISSRTSSSAESEHLSASAAPASNGSSSSPATIITATPAAVAFDAAAFKMHLPLRCRFPHRFIPGTYYDVLALPRDCSQADIIAKYRAWQKDGFKRMRLIDPIGAEAVDRMIVESRNVLGNPVLRAAYDQQLPCVETKQQPWSAASGATTNNAHSGVGRANVGAASTSTITTPSKRCTQGQSSATSSTSDVHHRPESANPRLGYSSSCSSSIYHADAAAPVVTISSMCNNDSIW